MATMTESPVDQSPLTVEQMQLLVTASRRAGKVRGAAKVAAFNGWTSAFFAVVSLLLLPFGISLLAVFITVGLAVVAFNEFRGRRMLRRFDVAACKLLGWNQVAFMSIIVIYCAWSLIRIARGPDIFADLTLAIDLGDMEEEIHRLVYTMLYATYGSVIVATVIFQGGNAWYYFSRGKILRNYLAETPPWVVEVLRATIVA